MNIFHVMAHRIYDHICGYLPWGYLDHAQGKTIDVLKINDGLRVITTESTVETGYKEITIDIPQSEIERLLAK